MKRSKINPRVLNPSGSAYSHSSFYRLVSSQRFLALIGLIFLALILFPLARTYSQKRLVEKEIADVKKEISEFESANEELKEMIAYLESGQSLEEQARLNLNLKKPGEKVIVIENLGQETSHSELNKNTTKEGNFSKWWHYFFD